MNQVALALETPAAEAADRRGFDIGWDHAQLGLVPAAELLQADNAVYQGWRAGQAVLGRRVPASSPATRQWLGLRIRAWREGAALDAEQLTPATVARALATHCPVLRLPLGGAANQPDAAQLERPDPTAAWSAGNLAMLSQRAAQAWQGMDLTQLLRQARTAQWGAEPVCGLDAAAWWRLAALRSLATPLPFSQAARLPLALLPPPQLKLANAVQRLQWLLTLQFTTPGWAQRCRRLVGLLDDAAQRHDFNFFVAALAPRVLEADGAPRALQRALEDAWLHERVQRRWQQLALNLGEAGCAALLQRAQGLAPAPATRPRHAAVTPRRAQAAAAALAA